MMVAYVGGGVFFAIVALVVGILVKKKCFTAAKQTIQVQPQV